MHLDYFSKMMAQNKHFIYDLLKRVSNKSQTSKGRDVLIFFVFLCIASIFWLLSNLNNEIEENIAIPIEIIEIPDSITILNEIPTNINVSIKEKGTTIIKYMIGELPPIKVKFLDYSFGRKYSERFLLKKTDIEQLVRQYFWNGIHITSIQPDSIRINYTSAISQKIKININTDVHSHFQYIINGEIKANTDSVLTYKISETDTTISVVDTELIKLTELKDTTIVSAHIKPIKGFKIVPEKISITIPVEPLIAKKQSIIIKTMNVPNNIDLILFPQKAEISYLLPMSKYNASNEIIVFADYNYLQTNNNVHKIPLNISDTPDNFRNIELLTDSVEFIIEQI